MNSKVTIKSRSPRYKPFAPPNRLQPLPKISSYNRSPKPKRRMNELPSAAASQEYVKPKVVLFYKNGDRNFRGSHVTVTPRRFRNFDNLLNELTRITKLAQGARYIFTPDSGSRVISLEQLSDGKSYVCGSHPKLKKIKYNHAPDGSNHNQKKRNRNFIPVPPASKLNVENSRANSKVVRPKVVRIVRNGVGINKKTVKLLLNKRTAQSYEQVLDDITSIVGVQGGFVKKLYDKNGSMVHSISDLFSTEDVFIAVGSEKFRVSDIPRILEEADTDNGRSKTNPDPPIKRTIIPSPPKTLPTKRKKMKPQNSPYNTPPPFTTHSKLPSIKKRKEPDGASDQNDSNDLDSNHVTLNGNDMPDTVDRAEKVEKEKSSDDILSGFLDRQTSTNSNKSDKSVEDKSTPRKETSVNGKETLNRSSSIIADNKEGDIHVDLSDTESKSETVDSPRNNKRENTEEKVDIKSPSRSSSVSSDSDDSDSDTEKEDENDENSNENVENEKALDISLKNDINDLIAASVEPSAPEQTSEKPVYKEQITKVFDSQSEIKEYYEVGKKLGDGNFAVVKEVVDKRNDMSFAMKIIDAAKMEGKLPMLQNEIKIQRDCSHPNIVRLYHDMHSPTEIFLIMELISGGDFFDLISSSVSFEEIEASGYMRDLCSGLDYLHQRGIVHRDIKPENLMVYTYLKSLKFCIFCAFEKMVKTLFCLFSQCL